MTSRSSAPARLGKSTWTTDVLYLLDTNVISEFRKAARCDQSVQAWRDSVAHEETFLSVIVMGELQRGIERIRGKDEAGARRLDQWLRGIKSAYAHQILPVTSE